MNESKKYLGWSNYETWNVSLWIKNTYKWYLLAKKLRDYKKLVKALNNRGIYKTNDGVSLNDKKLNIKKLNESIREE